MKMKLSKLKIQSKLTLAFLVMGLVPMTLAIIVVVRANIQHLDREIEAKLWRSSRQTMQAIQRYSEEAARVAGDWIDKAEIRTALEDSLQRQREEILIIHPDPRVPKAIFIPGRLEGISYKEGKIRLDGFYQAKPTMTIMKVSIFESLLAGVIMPVGNEQGKVGNLIIGYALGKTFAQDMENLTGVNVRIFRRRGGMPSGLEKTVAVRDLVLRPEMKERVFAEKKPFFDDEAIFKGQPYKGLYQPLLGSNEKMLGMIFFGVPQRHTFEAMVATWRFFPLLIALGVVMATALSYTIARRLSRRISLFAEAAHSVADGKLDQEIRVRGGDEIGDLASAFNLMLGRLRQMRELEEELRRKDRLAALGELSAGIAHEVRNPLGIIKNSAQILQDRLKSKELKSKELTNFIIEETDRLNKVVTNFLDFARPQEPDLEKGDIIPVLDKVLGLLESQTSGGSIKVVRKYEKGMPSALVDEDLLSQVFFNLIANALQAMPEGGTLTVATQLKVESRKFKAEEENPLTETNFLEISFADTGCGIPEEKLSKIFNPFFSLREGGTGLGLSIVHKIIESHGGEISVESRVGKGTTFFLRLPASS